MTRPPGSKSPDPKTPRAKRVEPKGKDVPAESGNDLAAISGVALAKPQLTVQLETTDLIELKPGQVLDEGKIVIDGTALASPPAQAPPPSPAPAPAPAPAAPRPVAEQAPRAGGAWLVVLVYLLASAALAAAIYERYFL